MAKAPLGSRGPSIVQLWNYLSLLIVLFCLIVFFERGDAGQRPKTGESPVEHRGTFVCSFICLPVRLSFHDLKPEWVEQWCVQELQKMLKTPVPKVWVRYMVYIMRGNHRWDFLSNHISARMSFSWPKMA